MNGNENNSTRAVSGSPSSRQTRVRWKDLEENNHCQDDMEHEHGQNREEVGTRPYHTLKNSKPFSYIRSKTSCDIPELKLLKNARYDGVDEKRSEDSSRLIHQRVTIRNQDKIESDMTNQDDFFSDITNKLISLEDHRKQLLERLQSRNSFLNRKNENLKIKNEQKLLQSTLSKSSQFRRPSQEYSGYNESFDEVDALLNEFSAFENTSRSTTPVYFNGEDRASSSASMTSEPAEVPPMQVNLVKAGHRFWYKPNLGRDETISTLSRCLPGSFIIRDSNSFPGAFGLALRTHDDGIGQSPVKHFLIESTSKGVRLRGYSTEPVFASLSALVYQHSIMPMALPVKLILPNHDIARVYAEHHVDDLMKFGAACSVTYLYTMELGSLTGPQAIRIAVRKMLEETEDPEPLEVQFKVSYDGITLTDYQRKVFFRKHFPMSQVAFASLDPEHRQWGAHDIFGFVVKQQNNTNKCHIFADLDPNQPAKAVINFIKKIIFTSDNSGKTDIV